MKKFFFLVISLAGLCSFSWFKKAAFKLVDATSQHWTAGIPSGGSGTEYTFRIVIETKEPIRFDSVWMADKAFPIQAVKGKVFTPEVSLNKGDTVRLRVSDSRPGTPGAGPSGSSDVKEAPVLVKKSTPPVHYNGDALVRYYVGSKARYYTISGIKKLEPLSMP
jgi:hypothetical protein